MNQSLRITYIQIRLGAPHISPARGPPLWQDGGDAQMDDGARIEPAGWDLAVPPAPDFEVDQRISWCGVEAATLMRCGVSPRTRQIHSRLFARGPVIELPRWLKLHRSKTFESQNPCHTRPHATEFPIRLPSARAWHLKFVDNI